MKIYNQDKFNHYLGKPVRIKSMGKYVVAIAAGAILATFNGIKELRKYFPHGRHVE